MDIYRDVKRRGIYPPLFTDPEGDSCFSIYQIRWTLNGECLVNEVVYQATVKTKDTKETYIGLTANEFKARYRNHQMSFRHEKRKNETELSKQLWKLKEEGKDLTVAWKIIAKAKPYTNLTKRCNLCTTEKFFLLTKPHMATLNKRNELISTCRHRRKFILRYNSTWSEHSVRLRFCKCTRCSFHLYSFQLSLPREHIV